MEGYHMTRPIALHAYMHRVNDDHNARESYLFNLADIAVFEKLI